MAEKVAKQLVTNARWCKGCGICVEFCPKGVLGLVKQKCRILEPEKCTKCALCEMRCPDYAIWLEEGEVEENG
ncbi:MAG: 4Fe-4S binding protein [Clostridiales bacterium]|jgi:2-oxoglutarate ferredoxin oxidoreductase subunit delta|nr:4Fe-4S binding protein [Clostridiales bacterium]